MDRFDKYPRNYLEKLILDNLTKIYTEKKRHNLPHWMEYSNLLVEKFAIHASTFFHINEGLIVTSDSTSENKKTGIDLFTINSLIRVLIETYITFNHIYVISREDKEPDIRYLLWKLDGIFERQKFRIEKNDFNTVEEYLEKEENRKLDLIQKIKSAQFLEDYPDEQLIKIFNPDKRKAKWRFITTQGRIRPLQIIELIENTIPARSFYNFYKYASFHTHSGFVSIEQHELNRGKIISNEYSNSLIRLVVYLTMFLIYDITLIDINTVQVFNSFNKEIKDDIIGISKEFREL